MFLNAGLLIESVFKFYVWSRVVQRGVLNLGLLCNDWQIHQAFIKQLPNLLVCTRICVHGSFNLLNFLNWPLKYCGLIYTCNCLSYMGGMRNFRGLSQVLIGLSSRERIYRLNFPIKSFGKLFANIPVFFLFAIYFFNSLHNYPHFLLFISFHEICCFFKNKQIISIATNIFKNNIMYFDMSRFISST